MAYNGWTNQETWRYMLHVLNTEGEAERLQGIIGHFDRGIDWITESAAELIKADVYDGILSEQAFLTPWASDVLMAEAQSIDFEQVVRALREGAQ